MPLTVHEKVFSAAERGFISETHENLCCLEPLSENFSPKCVRTLECGFDANDYYRYFLKRRERFVIRAKKNRNVIYNGKNCNIMDVVGRCKGNYCMDFKDKSGRVIHCKMSCIPVGLCEFPDRELVLTVVYGFGSKPMLLLSGLKMQEKKKLCDPDHILFGTDFFIDGMHHVMFCDPIDQDKIGLIPYIFAIFSKLWTIAFIKKVRSG